MHDITNLSNLRDNYERKKHPCHTKLFAFRCFISRPQILNLSKLGRYHAIIEYRDINLEKISISDGFGFNRNIDISRYITIIAIAETSCTPIGLESNQKNRSLEHLSYAMTVSSTTFTWSLKTDDVKFH